jgi:hypothetical protein
MTEIRERLSSTLKNIDGRPSERQCRWSGNAHHQHKEMSMACPLGGGARGPGAPTINAKKRRWWAPRPPWGSDPHTSNDRGPGAPTINTKKHRRRAPLGDGAGDPRASTINNKKCQRWAPWEVLTENPGAPTINDRKCRWRAPGRCRSYRSRSVHHQR